MGSILSSQVANSGCSMVVLGCQMWGDFIEVIVVLRAVVDCERAASGRFYIHMKPRFRSEKSAADAKLEKTSLSAGGFLRVSYGYRTGRWLRYR